eukprot:5182424-Prymnesium_polylepis.1
MFADVSGFTKLTGALAEAAREEGASSVGGAEQLTRIINRYFNMVSSRPWRTTPTPRVAEPQLESKTSDWSSHALLIWRVRLPP